MSKRTVGLAALLILALIGILYSNPVDYYLVQIKSRGVSPAQQWQEDLQYLAKKMPERHKNLFHSISADEFQQAVDHLKDQLPTLTDNQSIVELMRLVALVSSRGRDGHTQLWPFQEATGFHVFPLRLYLFSDGLFVVDAQEPYQNAIGARLVKIGSTDIEEIFRILDPLIPRDNEMAVKKQGPVMSLAPEILHALGFIDNVEAADFTFEKGEEQPFTLHLTPITWNDYRTRFRGFYILPEQEELLYLRKVWEDFWFTYLEETNTLYLQYNVVTKKTASGETMARFSRRIETFIAAHTVDRMVIDLRHNSGGDNTTYRPLLERLSKNKAINQRGKLFTLIGRTTFSAAGNFATDMERHTETLFVGEPTGSSPNQYGDAKPLRLPHSKVTVYISSRYWQKSDPDDERLWHEPDIAVAFSSQDYFLKRDPVLEAVLNYEVER